LTLNTLKKKSAFNLYTCTALMMIFIFFGCSDDSTNPPKVNYADYYPNSDQTNYTYSITEYDSTGTLINSGLRFVLYNGDVYINNIQYKNQIDSVSIDTINSGSISNFRKTNTGVFYYVDTSEVANAIPDSLRNLVELPQEMRLLLYPLESGSLWPVYRVTVHLQSGIIFTPITISGGFVSRDSLTLNLNSGDIGVNTVKVKYEMIIIQDPLQLPQTYTSYAWFVENLGMVKMEGNSAVLNALITGEFNFEDSTGTISQDLIEYEIR